MKPDKIILWLGIREFPDEKLPPVFEKLKACGVEVKFREDIGPHTKYFYAMQEYPEDIIITFDDDFLYSSCVVEALYKSYLEHPDCVTGTEFHRLTFNPDGSIRGFDDWQHSGDNLAGCESHQFLLCGFRGVLYPPHSLHKEAFNVDMLKKLCPKADDVWLKFMEVMQGVRAVPAINNPTAREDILTILPRTQNTALRHYNDTFGGNDLQVKAILEAYSGWRDEKGRTLLEVIRED